MKIIAPLAAVAIGALATLTMLVLLVAGMPNASPEQLAEIRIYIWATAAVGVIGAAGGVFAMATGRHKAAAWAGIAPLGFVIVLFAALLMLGR